MIPDKVIRKVPGLISDNPKEKQGHIDDLTKLPKTSLLEILERQNKILSNRVFVSKLKDGGVKVKQLKEKVEDELQRRKEAEEQKNQEDLANVIDVLSSLRLGALKISRELEWTKKLPTDKRLSESGKSSVRFAPWRPKGGTEPLEGGVVKLDLGESLALETATVATTSRIALAHAAARLAAKSAAPVDFQTYRDKECGHQESEESDHHSDSD